MASGRIKFKSTFPSIRSPCGKYLVGFDELATAVLSKGGYEVVTNHKLWSNIADECLHVNAVHNAPYVLRELYRTYCMKYVEKPKINPSSWDDNDEPYEYTNHHGQCCNLIIRQLSNVEESQHSSMLASDIDSQHTFGFNYGWLEKSLKSTLPNEIMFSLNTLYLMLTANMEVNLAEFPTLLDTVTQLFTYYFKIYKRYSEHRDYSNLAGDMSALNKFQLVTVILKQIAMDQKNMFVILSHGTFVSTLIDILYCASTKFGSNIEHHMWQILAALVSTCSLDDHEIVEPESTEHIFTLISDSVRSDDLLMKGNGMNVLARILLIESNESVISRYLTDETLGNVLSILSSYSHGDTNLLVMHSVEVLYRMSYYPNLISQFLGVISQYLNLLFNLLDVDWSDMGIPSLITYQYHLGAFCEGDTVKDGGNTFRCQWNDCNVLCDNGVHLLGHVRKVHLKVQDLSEIYIRDKHTIKYRCEWSECFECKESITDALWHLWICHCYGSFQPLDYSTQHTYKAFFTSPVQLESEEIKSVRLTVLLTIKQLMASDVCADKLKVMISTNVETLLCLLTSNVDCSRYAAELLSLA